MALIGICTGNYMGPMGVHFICFTSHTSACGYLASVSILTAFKRMRHMANFLLVPCSCSKPINDACCLSFSAGRKHLAGYFVFNTETRQKRKKFWYVVCRQHLSIRLKTLLCGHPLWKIPSMLCTNLWRECNRKAQMACWHACYSTLQCMIAWS